MRARACDSCLWFERKAYVVDRGGYVKRQSARMWRLCTLWAAKPDLRALASGAVEDRLPRRSGQGLGRLHRRQAQLERGHRFASEKGGQDGGDLRMGLQHIVARVFH